MSNDFYQSTFPPHYTFKSREFEKALFIKDIRLRLQALKDLDIIISSNNYTEISPKGYHSVSVAENYNDGFRYGDVYKSTKRILIVDVYILDIIDEADKLTGQDKTNFIIDNRYKYHEGLFDTQPENIRFNSEVTNYVNDKLGDLLKEINSDVKLSPKQEIKPIPCIKWNRSAKSLGTLFAIFNENGLIDTENHKEDLGFTLSELFINKQGNKLNPQTIYNGTKLGANDPNVYDHELVKAFKSILGKLPKTHPFYKG